MKTIIIIQGKDLKSISSINRRIINLLGTLSTETTDFIGCLIYSNLLLEEEKEKLSKEFGEDYIISFVEIENDKEINNNKTYLSSKI